MSEKPPEQKAKWFYAFEEGWQTFSDEDDGALEARWNQLAKDGLIAKRDRELREREDEEEKKRSDAKKESTQAFPKPIAPSGVEYIKKSIFDTIGSGDAEQVKEQAKEDKTIVNEHLDPDEPEEERSFRVEVMEDHLFEVNIETMKLFPVFWKGVLLDVVRAHWFYASETGGYAPIPYNEGLSKDLETAYDKVKPWKRSLEGPDEKKDKTVAKEEELFELPSMDNKGEVHFQDATSGRIFTKDLTGRFMSVIGGSLVIRGWEETARRANVGFFQRSFLPWAGGKEQTQGDDESGGDSKAAQSKEGAAKAPGKAPASSSSSKGQADKEEERQGFFRLWPSSDSVLRPGVNLLRAFGWGREEAQEESQRAAKQKNTENSLKNEASDKDAKEEGEEEEDFDDIPGEPPQHLILAVHGIGQKMVEEWDAIDFIYDVEKLRNLSKKVANNASLRKISKGKRAQYLPISWRKDLSFDEEEPKEGNDNVYTLQDISNQASIPVIRNVISKVILDVPYYLSRHKAKMIEAVMLELNRVYRLFVRRNPDFEKRGGRVSLICHSLGSAIAADILSNQPTYVPPLSEQSKEALTSNKHLLFNVKNLFFIGSPNGFFFHLEGAQMIARRGTARTKNVADDAAKDEVGRYGCMAAEAIYNCYNSTDPVAFQLSATVDSHYARILRPISIPDAVPALLEALTLPRLSLSKLFDPSHPFTRGGNPAYTMETKNVRASSSQQASGVNTPKRVERGEEKSKIMIEKGTAQKVSQIKSRLEEEGGESSSSKNASESSTTTFDLERLQRAERRFRALNPHGCIDFIYDSGGYNQYLDMLSAHVSYWQSNSFATFVLLQLFSDFEEKKEEEIPTIIPTVDPAIVKGNERKKGEDDGGKGEVETDQEDDNDEKSEQGSVKGGLISAITLPDIM